MWVFLWFLSISFFLVSTNLYVTGSFSLIKKKVFYLSLASLTISVLINLITPERGMILFLTGLLSLFNGIVLLIRGQNNLLKKTIFKAICVAIIFLILGMVFIPAAGTASSQSGSAVKAENSSASVPNHLSKTTTIHAIESNPVTTRPGVPIQTSTIQNSESVLPFPLESSDASVSSTPPATTLSNPTPSPASQMKVHFLDVGQGSSTVFEIGDKVMIIDGGDRNKSSFVVAYLKKIGINKIDIMISTHYDSDHLNGLVGVLNVFPVDEVYDANYSTDTRVYNSFKRTIQDKSIPEIFPGMKQKIEIDDAVVTFVAPRQYGNNDSNDNSICIRVTFGQNNFLIMGDPSANAEQQILNQELQADVFLASHHGSNGSNSKTLLAKVKPDFVVISCGSDNTYGHPGLNTLARIRNTEAKLFRTDLQGSIICTSDGDKIKWDKSPCNDFTPGRQDSVSTPTTTAVKAVPQETSTSGITTKTAASANIEQAVQAYVLNKNTKKFHLPYCASAAQIKQSNRRDVESTRDSIIRQGYAPCKNCNP